MADKNVHFWDRHPSWREAERAWDRNAERLAAGNPLKKIKHWRTLPGIRASTAKNLRWKALVYLLRHDENNVLAYFWRKPLVHIMNAIRSYARQHPYRREGDFFLYGFNRTRDFQRALGRDDTIFLVGFSYCHKPFECPSGRFSDQCRHDANHPVCGQCFIGKCVHALPQEKTVPVMIPTVHYIAEKVVQARDENPGKDVIFLITACELTLEMFGDWGNMIDARGIGVRLDGQICNTMRAFEASEKGVKPGLAVVPGPTQQRMLALISDWRSQRTDQHPWR